MEWQIAYRPCPGNPRTKEPRKRRGPTPGRSSNAQFYRGLPFEDLRLYCRIRCLPPVLSVFFPLLLSWCLLYFCVFTFVNSGCCVVGICPEESCFPVRIERLAT